MSRAFANAVAVAALPLVFEEVAALPLQFEEVAALPVVF